VGGKFLALAVAGRNARIAIMVLAALWAGFLLYTNVAQTLNQPVQLPLGITPNNPELDSSALDTINNARINRSQYVFRSFAAYDPLFSPVPSVAPTTFP
jgi:hypothetical protein